MKKLIIIPAYNEEKNINKVIEDIKQNAPGFDYVIINDSSTDQTKEVCIKNGYNLVTLPINLGIGGAMQTGYLYAKRYGYDYAVQFDGDGQHKAEYLEGMLDALLREKLDMVIGSRFIDNEGFQSSISRRIGIVFLSTIIRLVSKTKITDPTSGLRMGNKKVIDSFCEYYPKDYPEPESVTNIIRQDFRVGEVPVIMRERTEGVSSINFTRSIYYMLKVSLAILIDGLKPKAKGDKY